MKAIQRTLLVIGLSAFALLAQEVIAIASPDEGDTISARGAEAIRQYPAVVALPVAVAVHMATPTALPNRPLPWWQGSCVAVAGGILLGLSWARYDRSRPIGRRTH